MTSARSKHNLDASWFDRVVHLDVVVVFLLELEQAVASGDEVINELESIHSELLCDS